MLNTALRFMSECDRVGLRYQDSRDLNDGGSLVVCGVHGKNNARYDVLFVFAQDQHTVSMQILGLLQYDEEHNENMLAIANELNGTYRWFKFFTKENKKINVQADAIISEETSGHICVELLVRVMRIIDEVYPKFMHALWS